MLETHRRVSPLGEPALVYYTFMVHCSFMTFIKLFILTECVLCMCVLLPICFCVHVSVHVCVCVQSSL